MNRAARFALLLLLAPLPLGGCGGAALGAAGSSPRSAPRADGQGGAAQVTVTVEEHLAPSYGGRQEVTLEGFFGQVEALTRAAAEALDRSPPRVDAAMQRLTAWLARTMPATGAPPAELLFFAMASHGLVEPVPHLLVVGCPEGAEELALEALKPRLAAVLGRGEYNRLGVALARAAGGSGPRRLVLALVESHVRLSPLPRRLSLGQRGVLVLQVAPRFGRVGLVVTRPDGEVKRLTLSRQEGRYRGEVPCAARGVVQVEVTGEGRHGMEVLANFPLYCAVDPPKTLRLQRERPVVLTVEALEADLARRFNAVREANGKKPLALDEALSGVARAHSEQMRELDFVGHVSPRSGGPSDRLRRAGVAFVAARENVARGYSPAEVVASLMQSPAHRANLLAEDVSVMGVGVALDRRGGSGQPALLVTQKLITPGTPLRAETATADLLRAINRARAAAGVPAVQGDEQLTAIARRHVDALVAAPEQRQQAEARLGQDLDGLGRRFRLVDSLHARLEVLESIAQAGEIRAPAYTHAGVAAGQVGPYILVLVLFGVAR